jgi:peptidyl-prolyl cis-trans isomerase C
MASPRPIAVRSLGVLAIAALLLTSCSKSPPAAPKAEDDSLPLAQGDQAVLRVNGVEIGQSDIAFADEEVGGTMPAMAPEQKREYLITYLTDVVILAQAAKKQKLDDSPEVKRQIEFARNKVLMEALLQKTAKAAETEPEMHKVYDEAVKEMGTEQEVHARHILVETEEDAKAVEAELKDGADFAEEAKKKSKDPGAANGGDLGWFTKDQMVPEFSEAAFKLDKGQISDPIHTQFGWHIIKVEDKRVKPTPSFEEVKSQVENYISRRAQAQLVDGLRKTATIERLDQPQAPSPMLNPGSPVKK